METKKLRMRSKQTHKQERHKYIHFKIQYFMYYLIISEGKGIPQYVPSVFHSSVVPDSCDPMDYSPPGSSVHGIF